MTEFQLSALRDFNATTLAGKPFNLKALDAKLVLVVNIASQCGFTPQYAGLEALHRKYSSQGLAVLGFPCNQFGAQEPGGAEEIAAFCEKNYGVSFPLFAKIEVNGAGAHPLYRWLTGGADIEWNFVKFLIGPDGDVLRRYPPQAKPEDIAADIEAVL